MIKNVCFLIYNVEPGGLQNYLFRFITYHKSHLKATIIVKNGQIGPLFNSFISMDVDVQPIKSGYLNIKGWYNIYKFFKLKRFDSVCDLTGNFSGIYLFLAKFVGIEKRTAFYGQSNDHFKRNIERKIYSFLINRLVYKYATCIISNSKTGMNYFFPQKKNYDPRFKIIANGINANDFSCIRDYSIRRALNIPDKAFVIGNTGRYDGKKNHDAILQLAKLSGESDDSFYYILCGYGTENLLPIISKMRLSEKVFVLGYRQDVPLLLRNFDAFYFPSFTEGLSNSLLEALLSGLPIVASNIEPNKEVLPSTLWPFLTAPDDYSDAYEKLTQLKSEYYTSSPRELRLWAISNFKHETLFKNFFDCL